MIVFTFRELKCAWRQAISIFLMADSKTKTNAHRLLLFYAVETGLKAALLKRHAKQSSKDFEFFFTDSWGNQKSGHDLNNLMDHLSVGAALRLEKNIEMAPLKISTPPEPRTVSCGGLNQIWRYGAKASSPSDQMLETKLLAIHEWICGELK